jgi:DNA-binding response OmpR family regulator
VSLPRCLFMRNPEMTFTHLKLLRALRGNEMAAVQKASASTSTACAINGLRRKIEDDPATPRYILTEP